MDGYISRQSYNTLYSSNKSNQLISIAYAINTAVSFIEIFNYVESCFNIEKRILINLAYGDNKAHMLLQT